MSAWFDNQDLWRDLEPFLFRHIRSEAETEKEVAGLISLLDIKSSDHILDLCCGTGRVAFQLARRGFKITGVDGTEYYLNKARSLAGQESLAINFIHNDMRGFRRPEEFDVILNLFTSFGYFEDPHDDAHVLKNMFDSLRPGGRFLIDTMGREPLKRVFRGKTWYYDEPTETYLLEQADIKAHWDWVENHWTIIRGKKQVVHKFGIRIYSGEELRELFIETGFKDVSIYGSLQGAPYDDKAERLVVIGKKEKSS